MKLVSSTATSTATSTVMVVQSAEVLQCLSSTGSPCRQLLHAPSFTGLQHV